MMCLVGCCRFRAVLDLRVCVWGKPWALSRVVVGCSWQVGWGLVKTWVHLGGAVHQCADLTGSQGHSVVLVVVFSATCADPSALGLSEGSRWPFLARDVWRCLLQQPKLFKQQPFCSAGGVHLLRLELKPAGTFFVDGEISCQGNRLVHHYHVDNCNWEECASSSSRSAGVETELHVNWARQHHWLFLLLYLYLFRFTLR